MTQSQSATGDGGRRPRRLRRLVAVVAVVVAVAVIVPSALGGTGVGAVFNLGRTNTVNSQTTLKGSLSSSSLRIENAGSGSGLSISTKSTVAPLRVSSKTKVPNLNADLLDGLDSAALMAPGDIYRTFGPTEWMPNANFPAGDVQHFANVAKLVSTSASQQYFQMTPVSPAVENEWQYALKSATVCITAASSATVARLELEAMNSALTTSTLAKVIDTTVYSTKACPELVIATPVAGGHAVVVIAVNFASTGGSVSLGDVTLRWVPVAPATAPAAPAGSIGDDVTSPAAAP